MKSRLRAASRGTTVGEKIVGGVAIPSRKRRGTQRWEGRSKPQEESKHRRKMIRTIEKGTVDREDIRRKWYL